MIVITIAACRIISCIISCTELSDYGSVVFSFIDNVVILILLIVTQLLATLLRISLINIT